MLYSTTPENNLKMRNTNSGNIVARVNNIYIEESILLPNTPVEERSVKL